MDEADLTAGACLDLLRSATLGRVAIATPTGPDVVPVEFRIVDLDGEPALVLSTTPYSVLDAADPASTLAFEADEVVDGERWYVVVRGRVRPVTDGGTLELIRAAWGGSAGRRRVFLVVERTDVNGRRLGTGHP